VKLKIGSIHPQVLLNFQRFADPRGPALFLSPTGSIFWKDSIAELATIKNQPGPPFIVTQFSTQLVNNLLNAVGTRHEPAW